MTFPLLDCSFSLIEVIFNFQFNIERFIVKFGLELVFFVLMEKSYGNNVVLYSQCRNSRPHLHIMKRTMLAIFECHGSNLVSLGFDGWVLPLLVTGLSIRETLSLEACLASPLAMQSLFKGCCF